VDTEKTGFVKYDVFFQLLDLHKVALNSDAVQYLKKNFSRNQTINFKEAINQITIDLEAAGGTNEDATDGKMKWTVFALQPRKTYS